MKQLRLILLSVLGAIGLWMGPVEAQTRLEQEILNVLEEYVRATNEGDVRRLSELYLDSPTTGSIGDGTVYRGWSTVAGLLAGIYSAAGTVSLSGTGVTITPLGPDAAVAYFETEWEVGEELPTTSRGAMTIVFVRTDDGWRVAHDHTSTVAGSQQTLAGGAGLPGGPSGPVRQPRACQVARIVDGDTIDCDPLGRIRLIGMDTPEADQDPFGDMATAYLAAIAPVGSQVGIEPDVESQDRYGRVLGYVWADGVMVNWALVRAGYAVLLTYPPNVQYVEWFQEAQEQARGEGVGLWGVGGFDCPPQAHRRRVCEG